jgi:type VI secretion system secreted protein VgrG
LKGFDPASDVSINLIGLFDTVAAISDPLHGDFSPGDDVNRGVNLYLPPDCARQVIHLQALDEYRADFSLNNVHHAHLQIGLPGAHSDVGGGYLPRAREKLWMTQPCKASVPTGQRVESHAAWARAEADAKVLRESGVARDGYVAVKAWPAATNPRGKAEPVKEDYWTTVLLDRPVHGELSLIALRVMREKVWMGGSCLGYKEVGRYQAKVEPRGPNQDGKGLFYRPPNPEAQTWIDQHGIPYGSW